MNTSDEVVVAFRTSRVYLVLGLLFLGLSPWYIATSSGMERLLGAVGLFLGLYAVASFFRDRISISDTEVVFVDLLSTHRYPRSSAAVKARRVLPSAAGATLEITRDGRRKVFSIGGYSRRDQAAIAEGVTRVLTAPRVDIS